MIKLLDTYSRRASVLVCAGFFEGDQLFEVSGLVGERKLIPAFLANTFSTLTRGAPTRPSPLLQSLLNFSWSELSKEPLYLLSQSDANWDETIKGSEEGYKPALDFFNALPQILGPWAFISQLVIPEYPLFKRLGAQGTLIDSPNDELVDFYLPQADIVIEIDGGQHKEKRQLWKDQARDRFLERLGIKTVRLKTEDFRSRNQAFGDFIDKLIALCENAPRLAPYTKFQTQEASNQRDLRFELTGAIRLQAAVILAVSHGMLDLTQPVWKFRVQEDFLSLTDRAWVKASIDDLMDWLALFARLDHCEFTPPRVEFDDDDGLLFDVRIFSRPDDYACRDEGITIRTCAVQDHPFPINSTLPPQTVRLRYYGLSQLAAIDNDPKVEHTPSVADLTELSRRVFGHERLRPGQDTLIVNAISGQKSLGLMPTGAGKSLCFQVPALLGQGTTIVVVPIKALGRDHRAELDAVGFSGRVINIDSDTPAPLRERAYRWRILRGDFRFVFVSPERFQTESFREIVTQLVVAKRLQMFVIDEVHCMSEWGHDFRPSYLTLPGTLRSLAPEVPILGLTATASVNVLKDIQNEFEIPDELVAYEMHRTRSELNFSIRKGLGDSREIAQEVALIVGDEGISDSPPIHIFSRYANGPSGVEGVSATLAGANLGLRIGFFSGATPKDYRPESAFKRLGNDNLDLPPNYEAYKHTVQDLWKRNDLDVMITTKAFGMGVNKANVRHTLHAGMPGSMEAFYQEAGRAGRDRIDAHCHMLFNPEPDNAEDIFLKLKKDLSPEAIVQAVDSVPRSKRGDFRAQLWFLAQGLVSTESEQALVSQLHEIVRASDRDNMFIRAAQLVDAPGGGVRFQLTLYRLYQMGLISPWTVTDWGRAGAGEPAVQVVRVQRRQTSFATACSCVMARIEAVDGMGAESEAIGSLKGLVEGEANWSELYRILLEWVSRTQLGSRLQSSWNLYNASSSFSPEKAGEFRDELEAFFKVDSSAFQLAALRDMVFDDVVATLYALVSTADGNGLRAHSVLRTLSAQLSRLLEGTQENRGLNFAAGCLQLMSDNHPGPEARMRLMAAVPEGALSLWNGKGRQMLSLVASSGEVAGEVVGDWLLQDRPDRETLLEIYRLIPASGIGTALFGFMATDMAATI